MRVKSLLAPIAVAVATTAAAAPAGASIPHDPATPAAPALHRATDLRSPDSVDRASIAQAAATRPVPGPPTWPVHPQTLASTHGSIRASGSSGGFDVPDVALLGGGVLALVGASG